MTFVLHQGERADVLADALAEILAEPLSDPFQAEVVAVHARGIERWLTNRLATRLGVGPNGTDGVCANLSFPFPGRLVSEVLAAATDLEPGADPWEPSRLVWPLLEVVDDALGEPWLGVLADHIGGGDPSAPSADRRFAAVRHVAHLFDRYAVHRPDMVRAWLAGRDEAGDGSPLASDARWQAELWRRLRRVVDAESPPERLARGCARLVERPGIVDLPSRVSLFGLTRLPVTYLDVLRALAVHRDVHVLALHPSGAAWTGGSAAAGEAGGAEAEPPAHHPLLGVWGRDSREMHEVLAARLRDDDGMVERHHPLPVPTPRTLLARLQADIRADRPLPSRMGAGAGVDEGADGVEPFVLAPEDRSVQVHACHGRARQAEVVRDAITHLLADDPTLEPRDVVVLCPDIDEMAPLLRAAFDAGRRPDDREAGGSEQAEPEAGSGRPYLPYRLADRSLRQTNPVLGATAELLALVDGRLTASEVLAFASSTPVRHRFRFDDDDLETIGGWVDATGTRWGLDAAHRAPFDLASVATGTWQAGMERLLLGVAMAEDGHRLVGGVLPLDDVDSGDIELAGRVAELIGRLASAVEELTGPHTIAGWVAAIDRAADRLLHTRPGDAWQRAQLDHLLAEVGAEAGPDASPAELRLAEVRDLLADRLRGRPTRAAFRTGDLTMCTLVPMRSVPHRVVCVVGLDDGAFPRLGPGAGDDLLLRDRRPGDHDRRSEDRQLLLDALMSATDAVVVTYAGRDVRTNEVLPPAVPVDELLDAVDRTGRTGDGRPAREQVVHHHPLQPADPRCFRPGELGTSGAWSYDRHLLAGARAAASGRAEPPPAFLTGPLAADRADVIELVDLVRFVEQPVAQFLRQRLGLGLWSQEAARSDALPVELDALESWAVGDRVLAALLAGIDLDTAVAAERSRGLLPPGALAERVLADAAAKALTVFSTAEAVAAGPRTSLEVDAVLPDGRRVVGTVPDVVGDVIREATVSRLRGKHRIGAWARFVAATAAHPSRRLSSATVGWGRAEPSVASAAPVGADALAHLATLVDLRDRGLREPLPLAAKASYEYAAARREDRDDPIRRAEWAWNRGRYPGEQSDAAHVRAFGGERPLSWLMAARPLPDESGAGWAEEEESRFGRLARRLWDPVLDHTQVGSP